MRTSNVSLICTALAATGVSGATIVWNDVESARAYGSATSAPWDGEPVTDEETRLFPAEPLPLHVYVYAHVPGGGYASGTSDVSGGEIALDGSAGVPSAWIAMSGQVRTPFVVHGGSGPVTVEIPIHVSGFVRGGTAFAHWSAGVEGLGSISGSHCCGGYEPIDEEHIWSGTLQYGSTYVFKVDSDIDGSDDDTDSDIAYTVRFPVPSPVSVPAGTLASACRLLVTPNPASGGPVCFRVEGKGEGSVRIRIFGQSGRLLAESPRFEPARGDVTWEWGDAARRVLGSGAYFALVWSDSRGPVAAGKVIVIR